MRQGQFPLIIAAVAEQSNQEEHAGIAEDRKVTAFRIACWKLSQLGEDDVPHGNFVIAVRFENVHGDSALFGRKRHSLNGL